MRKYAILFSGILALAASTALAAADNDRAAMSAACAGDAPAGGVYLRPKAQGRATYPALYRTADGLTYEAIVSNPIERSAFRGGQVTTKTVYTVWISNPIRNCLWTYLVESLPKEAPPTAAVQWPVAPPLLSLSLRPVY